MDVAIIVALIAAGASLSGASLTFYLTKREEGRRTLQARKLEQYRELLGAISDLGTEGRDWEQANQRFAHACNTIVLVAPQPVIDALMTFHDEIRVGNPARTQEGHDRRLIDLVLALRASMELPFDDDPSTFRFRLLGGRIGPG